MNAATAEALTRSTRGPEAGFVRKTAALIAKDLRIELRARDTVPPMIAFAFSVTILLAFALPPITPTRGIVEIPLGAVRISDVVSAFLWITILFAGLIGFGRGLDSERADGALDALLLVPLDRSGLFLAKAAVNLCYLVAVQVLLVPAFAILFATNLGTGWFVLIFIMAIADIGFVMVGTLLAALAASTRSRELMGPVLALPLLVPLFIAAVALTSDVLAGTSLDAVAARGWFGILVAFDIIFTVAGALTYEFALDQR